MPDIVFRVVLPVLWVSLGAGVAANRWRVQRRLGRDPVVARPGRKAETPAGYLEAALSVGALLLTLDIAMNAIAPRLVARTLAIVPLRDSRAVGTAGLALIVVGLLVVAVALRHMSVSWRIGIDAEAPGPLVVRGIFSRVRHPIYSGMLLATSGIAAVTADLAAILLAGAAWIGLPIQARLEEAFLLGRHPEEYPAYLRRTGRFWPRLSAR